jgi:YD repeat-containing protein
MSFVREKAPSFGFDQRGTQSTVTDATGNTWTSTYDVLGRVVAKSDPDAGDSTMSYDADGDLLQSTDSRNKSVSYTYDGLGRKTGAFDAALDAQAASNQTAKWEYDDSTIANSIGHVTTATSYSGGAAYVTQATGFTTFGASLGQTITVPGTTLAGSYTFTHTYDTYVGLPLKDGYPSATGLPSESVVHSYTGAMDAPTGLTGTIGLKGLRLHQRRQLRRVRPGRSGNPGFVQHHRHGLPHQRVGRAHRPAHCRSGNSSDGSRAGGCMARIVACWSLLGGMVSSCRRSSTLRRDGGNTSCTGPGPPGV